MTLSAVATNHRTLLENFKPGDRVRVIHRVKVGGRRWKSTTTGAVIETRRRRTGIHTERAGDDHVYVDTLVLKRDDGERTTLTLDEFTEVQLLPGTS